MKHHITIIALLFLILFIAFIVRSEPSIDNISKNSASNNNLDNLAFANVPHSNNILDSAPSPKNNVGSTTITKEMIAWEMIKLSWGILAFGLFLILFIGAIAYKKQNGWDKELTRIFTVSIVIIAGLFLITAGYTDQQIAPMFGLLGTMVGYILGKSSPTEEPTKPAQ
jgi:hypothetical protein